MQYKIDFFKEGSSRNIFIAKGVVDINISKKILWQILISKNNMEKIHPFCMKHTQDLWGCIGNKDVVQFYSGKQMFRELIEWNEGLNFKVKIDNNDSNLTYVNFIIEENSVENKVCQLVIEIETNSYRKVPRPIWRVFVLMILTPLYKKYLQSLLSGVKFYSEVGDSVVRNQFGHHRIYSPKIQS